MLAVAVVRPESRGKLRLRSADPKDAPVIDLNLLATPRDRSRMLEGLKLSRGIGLAKPSRAVADSELLPGEQVQDDADLQRAVDAHVSSFQHATSTVPMGGDNDEWAVVDGAGAVRGSGTSGHRCLDPPRGTLRPDEPDRDHGGRAHLPARARLRLIKGTGLVSG